MSSSMYCCCTASSSFLVGFGFLVTWIGRPTFNTIGQGASDTEWSKKGQVRLTNADDGVPVRHETHAVVKDAPSVEQGQREPKQILEPLLERIHLCPFFVRQLVKHIVLAKRKDGYQIGAVDESARTRTRTRAIQGKSGCTYPFRMAILINPRRLLSVRSAVPGRAAKLSEAPPTTMAQALPLPLRRMASHDRLDTLQMPRAMITSRKKGMVKLVARVSRCGVMPGKLIGNSVASVARLATAATPRIPCGW